MSRNDRKKNWVKSVCIATMSIGTVALSGCNSSQLKGESTLSSGVEQKRIQFGTIEKERIEEGTIGGHHPTKIAETPYTLNKLLAVDNSNSDSIIYGDLYFISENQEPQLICRDIKNDWDAYTLAPHSGHIAYMDRGGRIYLKKAGEKAVQIGYSRQLETVKFTPDEKYFYCHVDEDGTDAIYIYEVGDTIKEKLRLFDVFLYEIKGDDVYYISSDNDLYKVSQFKQESFLASDVVSFVLSDENKIVINRKGEDDWGESYVLELNTKVEEPLNAYVISEIMSDWNGKLSIYLTSKLGGLTSVQLKLPGQESISILEDAFSIKYFEEDHILYYLMSDGLYSLQLPEEVPAAVFEDRSALESLAKGFKKSILVQGATSYELSPNGRNIIATGWNDSLTLVVGKQAFFIGEWIDEANVFNDYLLYYDGSDDEIYMQEITAEENLPDPYLLCELAEPNLNRNYVVDKEGECISFVSLESKHPQLIRVSRSGDVAVLDSNVHRYSSFVFEDFLYSRDMK